MKLISIQQLSNLSLPYLLNIQNIINLLQIKMNLVALKNCLNIKQSISFVLLAVVLIIVMPYITSSV